MPHRFLRSTGIPPNTLQMFVGQYYIGVICGSGGWGVQATSNTLSSNTIHLLTLEYRTFQCLIELQFPSSRVQVISSFCLAGDPRFLITCLHISVSKFTWSNFVIDAVLNRCNWWLFIINFFWGVLWIFIGHRFIQPCDSLGLFGLFLLQVKNIAQFPTPTQTCMEHLRWVLKMGELIIHISIFTLLAGFWNMQGDGLQRKDGESFYIAMLSFLI